jgi:hypothetical protein
MIFIAMPKGERISILEIHLETFCSLDSTGTQRKEISLEYLTNSIFDVVAPVLSMTLQHCRSDSWMEAEGYASIFWLCANPS